jgi:hypothetical protein
VLSGVEPVLPPIKTPRVTAQNGGFVFVREIGPFEDFVDFFHAIGNGNLALIMASASLLPLVSPTPGPTCSLAIEVPDDRI